MENGWIAGAEIPGGDHHHSSAWSAWAGFACAGAIKNWREFGMPNPRQGQDFRVEPGQRARKGHAFAATLSVDRHAPTTNVSSEVLLELAQLSEDLVRRRTSGVRLTDFRECDATVLVDHEGCRVCGFTRRVPP